MARARHGLLARALGLEAFRQPLLRLQRSHFLGAFRPACGAKEQKMARLAGVSSCQARVGEHLKNWAALKAATLARKLRAARGTPRSNSWRSPSNQTGALFSQQEKRVLDYTVAMSRIAGEVSDALVVFGHGNTHHTTSLLSQWIVRLPACICARCGGDVGQAKAPLLAGASDIAKNAWCLPACSPRRRSACRSGPCNRAGALEQAPAPA